MVRKGIKPAPEDYHTDLRVSPKMVAVSLFVPMVATILLEGALHDSYRVEMFCAILCTEGAVSYAISNRHHLIARWFLVIATTAVIVLLHSYYGIASALVLLAFPPVLAVALIGLSAGTATAFGVTSLLLLLFSGLSPLDVGSSDAVVALAAMWAGFSTTAAIHVRATKFARWSRESVQHMQVLLEANRDSRAELKQALEDGAHANREMAFMYDRLAIARLAAEMAQKTKAAFVSNVSHELRTPLNIILGLAEIVLDAPELYGEELPPNVRRDLSILYRNCEHLSTLINDVLDLSQVEAGHLPLHRELVDPRSLIDSCLAIVRPLLDKKRLDLQVLLASDLPRVYCDPARIRQVILNLVSNAARYTEEGSIIVEARTEGRNLVVSVTDTGPGIAPGDVERIFEPFQRASNPPLRRNGSGLGLSISKHFVELHEGRMWVESKVGAGSRFSFELPIVQPTGHVALPQRWIAEGWVRRSTGRTAPLAPLDARLVICDGTGELRPLLSRYVEGVELVDARDLARVYELLQQTAAQAVLINEEEPQRLLPLIVEASERIPDTPIIGCCLPPTASRALDMGATKYLCKPVARSDVQEVLASVGKPLRRVLAVDDDEDTLRLFARMLLACDHGLEVTTALSGPQALAELRERPPDLMLLDVVMPDVDGWQVLAAKAEDETIRNIPVAIISAKDMADQPKSTRFVVATVGNGLSVSKLLRCSQALSALLVQPD